MKVRRLDFRAVQASCPERWQRGRPGGAFVNPHDETPGRWIVRRQGADEWHECVLCRVGSDPYGSCDCDGWRFNQGPCSHLCAVWRSIPDKTTIPNVRPLSAAVELRSADERRAATAAEPEVSGACIGGSRA